LPAGFGSLSALKHFSIFSGALTTLPDSMGNLKKLEHFSIDAVNVKKLPTSFNRLSYIKDRYINIGTNKNIKHGPAGFSNLVTMGYQYQWKFLETLSIKELESLLRSAPSCFAASEEDNLLFKNIMAERRRRLNRKFKWNDEHKKRVVRVSDAFLQAWEDGFARAKKIVAALEPAHDEYDIQIVLYPEIENLEKIHSMELYNSITSHLNAEFELSMHVKNENEFREHSFVSRDLSWNIEGFGDIELEDCYICYALHILYSHNDWANEDILRINNISTEIRISGNSGEF